MLLAQPPNVAHADVQPAELGHGVFHHFADGVLRPRVGGEGDGPAAHAADLGGDALGLFRVQIDDRRVAAGLGEDGGDSFAHPLPRTGDEADLTLQAEQ